MDAILPPTATILPSVICQPWCVHQSGHTEALVGRDQWCTSVSSLVPTALHPSVEQEDGTFAPEVVRVYGRASHQGLSARVHVSLGEDYGVIVTISEARQVAAAMIALADRMEAGR